MIPAARSVRPAWFSALVTLEIALFAIYCLAVIPLVQRSPVFLAAALCLFPASVLLFWLARSRGGWAVRAVGILLGLLAVAALLIPLYVYWPRNPTISLGTAIVKDSGWSRLFSPGGVWISLGTATTAAYSMVWPVIRVIAGVLCLAAADTLLLRKPKQN